MKDLAQRSVNGNQFSERLGTSPDLVLELPYNDRFWAILKSCPYRGMDGISIRDSFTNFQAVVLIAALTASSFSVSVCPSLFSLSMFIVFLFTANPSNEPFTLMPPQEFAGEGINSSKPVAVTTASSPLESNCTITSVNSFFVLLSNQIT